MSGAAASRLPILPQFVALALVWGASFLFIRVALEGLSPTQVVLGRLVSGAVTIGVIALATRQRFPRPGPVWGHLAVVAALNCVIPFLLFAWAGQHIASGVASILNATTPLATVLIAAAMLPDERLGAARLGGLLAGFAGVVVVLGPWRGVGESSLLAQLACLGAAACYGLAFTWVRRFVLPRGVEPIAIATAQIGLGAIAMLALAPVIATQPIDLDLRVVGSILGIGVAGTGVAFVWNMNVLAAWGATSASTVTYLVPVIGLTLGVVVLGETFSWNQPTGALVVILGVAIAQGRLRRRRAAATVGATVDP